MNTIGARAGVLIAIAAMALAACDAESLRVDGDRDRIQGSGDMIEETRLVTGFTSISFFTEGSITITQGDEEALTVETDDNVMPYLETTVIDGVLTIRVQEGYGVDIDPSNGITWGITVVDLDSISLNGAGSLNMGEFTTDRLSLSVAGAMDVDIDDLNADALEVVVTGVGSIVLAGEVTAASLTLTGAGSIDTSDLSARQATALVSGVGDISVWAIDTLAATITGLGGIDYYGNPTVTRAGTGAGSIRSAGNK